MLEREGVFLELRCVCGRAVELHEHARSCGDGQSAVVGSGVE